MPYPAGYQLSFLFCFISPQNSANSQGMLRGVRRSKSLTTVDLFYIPEAWFWFFLDFVSAAS
jgi:hypothetical protein